MPWINAFNAASGFFGFILQEAAQLGEAPGVHAPPGLPAALFRGDSDIHQVLNDDNRTRIDTQNNTPADNVVAIPPKPLNLSAKSLQMSLNGIGALEFAFQSKVPLIDFLPQPLTVEDLIGCNGRSRNPEVYTDNLPA